LTFLPYSTLPYLGWTSSEGSIQRSGHHKLDLTHCCMKFLRLSGTKLHVTNLSILSVAAGALKKWDCVPRQQRFGSFVPKGRHCKGPPKTCF